ncbi:hypothetical protein BOX15_Mlig003773g3 [Macrostomum lignano]|uniref:Uncharacterized protein n=2 Tax=Macrostomum lignano TaxID=282301 RepID=A0A267G0D0_9PLAT|nr:hypothetical protein BOX15_Mlig003773g2 [Macrostomum lignano]PAA79555.1 hypothetical protein BOX15_Mlig003773g3 [Macrostomum lignano]
MTLKTRPKYFTPNEVAVHNTVDSLWVSFLGKVYDLTTLCYKHQGSILLKPIISNAGKDISHWFDPKTRDIRTHTDPVSGCRMPYTPHGRFVHVAPPYPSSDWCNDFGRPWWRDEAAYCIGLLSVKTRFVRVINTLTQQKQVIEVCSEETLQEILQRYLKHNAHAASYTWKYDRRELDMEKTLADNDIPDEDEEFYELKIDEEKHLQQLHLYFNDDLTEA